MVEAVLEAEVEEEVDSPLVEEVGEAEEVEEVEEEGLEGKWNCW